MTNSPAPTVLSLAQLLEQQSPTPPPCLVEPGLLPAQGILFVGGEPKVGKSLLVANLALSLAAGSDRTRLSHPGCRAVCSSASSNCRPAVCQPPGHHAPGAWATPPIRTCSWIPAPLAICSARPRD